MEKKYKISKSKDDKLFIRKRNAKYYISVIKNKIKYSYMDEPISDNNLEEVSSVSSSDDIEDVAKDIFGSFEVE